MSDDRQVSIERAEQIAGKRLDRRRRYAVIENGLCAAYAFTSACSGCTYDNGGYSDPLVGAGCEECGFTGKRRQHCWAPLIAFEVQP